jgi:hypothetical protein
MAVKKRTLLSEAIQSQRPTPAQATAQSESGQSKNKASTRVDTRLIGGHFSKPVQKQFKILAAEIDKTGQQLLEEALNDLFRKHGKEPIA